jgi:hypothetical protein
MPLVIKTPAAGARFNNLTKVYSSASRKQNGVYQQIDQIQAIGRSTVEVTVRDKDQFLTALAKQGYAINSADETVTDAYARITKGSVDHPFDSARARTIYATDPELHYANDRSNNPRYGSNYFFAHWDPTSVNCYRGCEPNWTSHVWKLKRFLFKKSLLKSKVANFHIVSNFKSSR